VTDESGVKHTTPGNGDRRPGHRENGASNGVTHSARRVALLLGQPVRSAGVRIGLVRDVFLTPDCGHVVGLELDGEAARFLPWIAVESGRDGSGVEIDGALPVLGPAEHAYYAARCTRLGDLAADAPERRARVGADGTLG
jgi:hypothetical protein